MATKLIVTNKKALKEKYGNQGWDRIEQALVDHVAADKARGVLSRWVPMDLKSGVSDFGAPLLTDPANPEQTKNTIDALCAMANPDYVMILGAPDVVCHQPLLNPVSDEDVDVPSDLPYACGVPFSEEAAEFTGPTRVVGRLPDLNGASDPAALLEALATATQWQSRTAASYKGYFALTALAWKKSTQKTVKNLFGSAKVPFVSPAAGQPWSKTELRPRIQLINCHGEDSSAWFYGDDNQSADFPTIHSSDYADRLREGTVVAAECCYGAQLYDPNFVLLFDPAATVEPGVCNSVLGEGAYGMLGSTNIAYGPAEDNDKADLMCLYFLRRILKGASLGRALLEARQEYVNNTAPSDPIDLKTLAQFNLLGNPAVHPVRMSVGMKNSLAKTRRVVSGRRKVLRSKGRKLRASIAGVRSRADGKIAKAVQKRIIALMKKQGLALRGKALSFEVHGAQQTSLAKSKSALAKAQGGGCFHVLEASVMKGNKLTPETAAAKAGKLRPRGPDAFIVAKEGSGKIESVQTLHRR